MGTLRKSSKPLCNQDPAIPLPQGQAEQQDRFGVELKDGIFQRCTLHTLFWTYADSSLSPPKKHTHTNAGLLTLQADTSFRLRACPGVLTLSGLLSLACTFAYKTGEACK